MSGHQASQLTIMFADLAGSTRLFEQLGNEGAAQAVTKITRWMSDLACSLGGKLVKQLGDGVLLSFSHPAHALNAAVQLQRKHEDHLKKWPPAYQVAIQIGLADGEVIEMDGDTYGDAVNTASRLSDLAGPHQIWALSTICDMAPKGINYRIRDLGEVSVRGKTLPVRVCAIDWKMEVATALLTVPAEFALIESGRAPEAASSIDLRWLDHSAHFTATSSPVEIGRQDDLSFVVKDQRVSRIHAVLSCDNGVWSIEDVSSYGTWVRFDPMKTEVALRRTSCVLHDQGEIALGAPFSDFSVVTVAFALSASTPDSSRPSPSL